MSFRFGLLTFLVVLSAWPAMAQLTNSSMTGFIKDETGQGLPGATVRAIHEPSGSAYGTSTQNNGSFNIQNMRVGGPYRVEVSYIGYSTQTFGDIFLTLGEPYNLRATLNQGGATELREVNIVAGRNPLMNNQRTGASTNVGAAQLSTLPTVSRSVTDFTRLSPQSGASGGSGLNNSNSFAGRDGRYNNVQINGANVNNAFGVSSNLLPGGTAQPISLDAIEEIQIGIAPYDVRQNNFTGANVNAITRSGNNKFTGSAYTYWRNQSFNGVHVGDRDLPDLGAVTNNIYGARIGGPIIKNKLFFFVNGEYEKFSYPGVSWVANRPGATGNVSRTPADSLELIRSHVMQKWGYDPGAYENYANKFTNKNTKFLARIDWNITDKHKLFISYSQLHNTSDQLINATSSAGSNVSNNRIGNNSISFQNSNYQFENTVKSFSAELTSSLGGKISNQLLATYTVLRDQRVSPSANFPFIDITSRTNQFDNYMSLGYELFSYQNDLKNKSLFLTDNFTYNSGHHSVTAGLSYEHLFFGNSFLNYGTGYYRYATVSDFINDRRPQVFAYGYPYRGNDAYANLKFGQAAAYAQDKIAVTDRISVTIGVRVDLPFYLNDLKKNPYTDTLRIPDKDGNLRSYDVSAWPQQRALASPRLGFNWDALGNRSLQVRGGTGIFTGRLPFVWFTNQVGNSGTLINTVTVTDSATLSLIRFNPDPNAVATAIGVGRFPTEGGASVPGEINVVSPDFKLPQVWRTNLAADFKLPFGGLIGTLEAVFTKDIVGVYQRNANLPAAQRTLNNGADRRPFYTSNRRYSNLSGIYILENTNQGSSFSFTVGMARPVRKGFYGSVYYTATYSEDVSSNPGSRASSAWNGLPNSSSPNDIVLSTSEYLTPHRLIGSLSYRHEYLKHFATTVSLFYEGASAGRYSYRYTSDINRDGVNADLIYIPNDASELQWANITYTEDGKTKTFSKQDQIAAFNSLINNDPYLSAHKGRYAERYGARYPFYHRFDLKILQDIFSNIGKRRGTLQLSLDMMNAGNFLNPNWGLMSRLNTGSGNNANILAVSSIDATNKPTFQLATYRDPVTNKVVLPTETFQQDFTTNSTWGMQLGVRLIF